MTRHGGGQRWGGLRLAVLLGGLLGVVMMVPTSGTSALFNDTATVTSGAASALTVPAPTNPGCVTSGPAVGVQTATVSWTTAGAAYSYRYVVTQTNGGAQVAAGTTTATSFAFTGAPYTSVLSTNYRVAITSFPTGVTSWPSAGSITALFRSRAVGLGVSCGNV